MKNALTIDFEDWFCVKNLSSAIKFEDWNKCELRVHESTGKILDLLDKYDTKATFFVLGWLAERVPELIKSIHKNGHEIASHGYSHITLSNHTPESFESDLKKAIRVKQKIIECDILGFRCPSFSITSSTKWAFEILFNNGIKYDSSVFPYGYHPEYGLSDAPTSVYSAYKELLEFPLSVTQLLGMKIPFGGGGYFRMYPYMFSRYLMKSFNKTGKPFVFYLHPWEIDYDQPRINVPFLKKFRHYYNIEKNFSKFENVLREFQFTTMRNILLQM